jgi:hypothetical protein
MSFDVETFMNSVSIDSPLSTATIAVDEGDYKATIDHTELVKPSIMPSGQLGSPQFVIFWEILDEALKLKLERDKVIVRQTIWLDVSPDGSFDTSRGKNVGLGRLREALGVNNQPGNPFKGLDGRMALVKVKQRSDPDNPEQKYAEVRKVAALPA